MTGPMHEASGVNASCGYLARGEPAKSAGRTERGLERSHSGDAIEDRRAANQDAMTDAPHVPVLKDETLGLLKRGPGKRIVDGTFGFGGHSLAILAKGAEVLGLDLDEEAVGVCRRISADRPRLHCAHSSFRSLDQALAAIGWDRADGLLLDLGVSSKQLDAPEKGFSYRAEGPLDLRFDRSRGVSATTLLADIATDELADLIWRYGEETRSRRIARSITAARDPRSSATRPQVVRTVNGNFRSIAAITALVARGKDMA